jgi:hypothetical protein
MPIGPAFSSWCALAWPHTNFGVQWLRSADEPVEQLMDRRLTILKPDGQQLLLSLAAFARAFR